MRLNTNVDAILNFAPNKKVFLRPMSHGARDTLYGLVDWGRTKLALFNNNPNLLMEKFGAVFDQIRFEEIEQSYDTEQYVKLVRGVPGDKKNHGIKVKTAEDVLSIMSLEPFNDSTWIHDNNIHRRNRVGDISQHRELYNWLVDRFLLADFTIYDVGKISSMGGLSSIEVIKREAQQIPDADKKTIPYLYAIIRSVSSRDEAVKARSTAEDSVNANRLSKLLTITANGNNKLPFKSDPDSMAKWERDRELIDLLRGLDD